MTEALIALAAAYLAYEASAWFPKLVDAIVRLAVRRLPRRYRARYLEEWRAHVNERPGAAIKLWAALGFVAGARLMFPAASARRTRQRTRRRMLRLIGMLDRIIATSAILILTPTILVGTLIGNKRGAEAHKKSVFDLELRYFHAHNCRTFESGVNRPDILSFLDRFSRRLEWRFLFIDKLMFDLKAVVLGHSSCLDILLPADERLSQMKRHPSLTLYCRIMLHAVRVYW